MNIRYPMAAAVAAGLCVFLLWPDAASPPESPPAPPRFQPGSPPGDSALSLSAETLLTEEQRAMLEDPKVLRFSERLAFEQRVRTWFENAGGLDTETLRASAQTLDEELTQYEAQQQVSAAEALMVRLAMIKITEPDEGAQKAAAQALIQRYQAASETRLAQWREHTPPEFLHYKVREKQIVEEVMAMTRFPDGMTRDEYLRQQLLQARIETMGQAATPDRN